MAFVGQKWPRAMAAWTMVVLLSMMKLIEAGDACCKAEAARRALIVDPFAVKPANWDDEDDGPWEAPKIAMSDLPAWYRLLRETKLGLEGAAPLLISGVIAAALLTTIVKPLVPSLSALLGRNKEGSSILDSLRGSILGLLVPFCSCGALPLAMTLKKEGIPSSSIAAFVVAAQAAGIDSLFFTYGVFGARIAILRMVAAGILAFLVGMTLATNDPSLGGTQKESERTKSCCGSDCRDEAKGSKQGSTSLVSSFSLFVATALELFSSVAIWVFLGVVVSAIAAVWIPPTSATPVHTSGLTKSVLSRAGLFLLTLPMTICEHGIVSLADALKSIGFSAGTAVALIVTGPSTNVGTLLMLSRLNTTTRKDSSNGSTSSNWIVLAGKIVLVILVFGVGLSYLADDFGSTIIMEKTEMVPTGSSSLPEWLNENAVSIAGLFTAASIVQSTSLMFQ